MLKLEDFTFNIGREQLQSSGGCATVDDLALDHLPSLRSVTVSDLYLYRDYEAMKDKVKSIREKLEHEAVVHPNHPLRIQIY
jgi:disease resistance protein RPM1